jgi:hypothetical protein
MKHRAHGSQILGILWGITILLTTGCLSHHHDYTLPLKQPPMENSIVINKSKDQVWKGIIPVLGGSFYVINNVDKDSGLINVSFSADPGKYIDCGKVHYDITNARGRRDYDFPGSISETRYEDYHPSVGILNVYRKMQLEGRVNFIVQELSAQSTRITANVKYVLTKSFQGVDMAGRQSSTSDSISFAYNQREQFPGGAPTTCQSNGVFEKDLLDLIRRAF